MIPKTIWGGGDHIDPNITRGRGYQYKDIDNFWMTYTTRTGYGKTPAGTEIGIRLRDDGCYYFDVEYNDWKRIGSMDEDEDEVVRIIRDYLARFNPHILLPKLPTQAQIDSFPSDSVVLVYDYDNPFVPEE